MNFTYRVYYEDDSIHNYGRILSRRVRAHSPAKAMAKFERIHGIKPLRAE